MSRRCVFTRTVGLSGSQLDGVDIRLLKQNGVVIKCHQQRAKRRHPAGAGGVGTGTRINLHHSPCVPRWAQPVVRFSTQLKSSYMAMAMAPMVTRPAKAKGTRCWLPAELIR